MRRKKRGNCLQLPLNKNILVVCVLIYKSQLSSKHLRGLKKPVTIKTKLKKKSTHLPSASAYNQPMPANNKPKDQRKILLSQMACRMLIESVCLCMMLAVSIFH